MTQSILQFNITTRSGLDIAAYNKLIKAKKKTIIKQILNKPMFLHRR